MTALTMLKMTLLGPTPNAMVITATRVKTGLFAKFAKHTGCLAALGRPHLRLGVREMRDGVPQNSGFRAMLPMASGGCPGWPCRWTGQFGRPVS
jgi:hypothetical protein